MDIEFELNGIDHDSAFEGVSHGYDGQHYYDNNLNSDPDQINQHQHQHYNLSGGIPNNIKIPDSLEMEEADGEEDLFTKGVKQLESSGLVDIGNLASWEVSSFKVGNEIEQMRDNSALTFWQSDGQQPHYLVIKFTKSVSIERICLFLNYQIDESYTPAKISILAGSGEHDLIEVITTEFTEPVGWQDIEFGDVSNSKFLKCFMLKIKFLSNHQNGKDCHVREVKIMSPVALNSTSLSNDDVNNDCVGFTSRKLLSESVIR